MPSRFLALLLALAGALQIAGAQVIEKSGKEDTTGMPRVVFYRPKYGGGSMVKAVVYCDLTKLAMLRNNTYFEIALSPGEHLCSSEEMSTAFANYASGGAVEVINKTANLKLEVKPGSKQWVSVRFKNVGMFHNTFKLTEEDAAAADTEMQKKHTQPVKPAEQEIRQISRTAAGPVNK